MHPKKWPQPVQLAFIACACIVGILGTATGSLFLPQEGVLAGLLVYMVAYLATIVLMCDE